MTIKPLTPYQTQVMRQCNRRLNILEGSIRSSKTVVSSLKWIRFVNSLRKEDDYPLLMMGKTERSLKRNIIDPMERMLGASRCKLLSGSGELILMGRRIYVAGANDERSVGKIAGITLLGAYADEISLYPEAVWKMLTSRLSLDDSFFIGTTNPDSPQHYLKTGYLDRAGSWINSDGILQTELSETEDEDDQEIDLFRATFRLQDNPHLSPGYLQSLQREYRGLWKKRYIDGLWVIAEGAIYEMFDEDFHVAERPRGNGPVIVGVDYGTTNPFAAIALEITPEGLNVFSEYYETRPLTDSQLSRGFKKWMGDNKINPKWICIDPSAASFIRQLFTEEVPNLVRAENAVLDGLRLTASLLSLKLLTISPKCKILLTEIPGYCWDAKESLKGEDKPIKKADHLCDALRYAVATPESLWRQIIRDVFDLAG